MELISLQFLHQKLVFTAYGFFEIDMTFVCAVIMICDRNPANRFDRNSIYISIDSRLAEPLRRIW